MRYCLGRSGVRFQLTDRDVDAADPPQDLQWYGNYATDELARLLDHTRTVLCPTHEGTLRVKEIATGRFPSIPADRRDYDVPMPETDTRGTRVVFTSAPNAVVETVELKGPGPATWEFVIRNEKGEWTEVGDTSLQAQGILPGGPVETVRTRFGKVPSSHRDRVRSELYRCIRLNQTLYPSVVRRMLRRRVTEELNLADIDFRASRAVLNTANGLWQNAEEPVPCNVALVIPSHGVIQTHERLGRVSPAQLAGDFEGNFSALKPGQLVVKLSLEASVEVAPLGAGSRSKV
jgi:hypothetical protein